MRFCINCNVWIKKPTVCRKLGHIIDWNRGYEESVYDIAFRKRMEKLRGVINGTV